MLVRAAKNYVQGKDTAGDFKATYYGLKASIPLNKEQREIAKGIEQIGGHIESKLKKLKGDQ